MSADTEFVLAIVGPTAVGKTALSVQCAKELDGELVGTDSMQAYQGLNIGTAKPSASDLAGIPHHMLDVWSMLHTADVAEFQTLARAAIQEIHKRHRRAIVVGGSVLYVNAVLDQFEFPGTDPHIRAKYEKLYSDNGVDYLHKMLQSIDPVAAANIQSSNARRLIRALEVNELTGHAFPAVLPDPVAVVPACRIGLEIDRETMDRRIASRVDHMFSVGLVDEVREAVNQGLLQAVTARKAIGYSQVIDCLHGVISEREARDQMIAATQKFARRQQRWFRQDPRIHWIPWDAEDIVERALGHFDEVLRTQQRSK